MKNIKYAKKRGVERNVATTPLNTTRYKVDSHIRTIDTVDRSG